MTNAPSALARTSFLEATLRVPLLEAELVPGRANVHRFRTFLVPLNNLRAKAALTAYWPAPPEDGTCAHICAMIAFDNQSDVVELVSSRDEAELAWGNVSDGDYLERNQTTTALRARCRGLCTVSSRHQFTLTGNTYLNGVNRGWTVKVNIDRASPRWAKFSPPKTGDIVGARGRLEAVETEPTKALVMTMESFSAPDSGVAASSVTTSPHHPRTTTIDDEWMAARQRALDKKRVLAAAQPSGAHVAPEHGEREIPIATAESSQQATEPADDSLEQGDEEEERRKRRRTAQSQGKKNT